MVHTLNQENMPPAPEGWAAHSEFDHLGNVMVWYWVSPDFRVAVGPHLGGFELFRFRNRVRLFEAPTREACVAWWTIEKSNESVVQNTDSKHAQAARAFGAIADKGMRTKP